MEMSFSSSTYPSQSTFQLCLHFKMDFILLLVMHQWGRTTKWESNQNSFKTPVIFFLLDSSENLIENFQKFVKNQV